MACWLSNCWVFSVCCWARERKRGYFIPLYWPCKIYFAFHDRPTHLKMEFFNELHIFKALNNSTWPVCKHQTTQITSFLLLSSKAFISFWHFYSSWIYEHSLVDACAFSIHWSLGSRPSSVYLFIALHSLTKQKSSNSIPGMAVKYVRASSYILLSSFAKSLNRKR